MTIKKEISDHLRRHIVYPATKKEIIEACNMMSDISKEDKELFEKNLPDWSFRNPGEVIRAVQVVEHLEHVDYPTTKKEIIKACNKMTDVPRSYREWFDRNLPERSFKNREEVIGTLKGIMHVREHVNYPATKSVIVETCNKMMEVPKDDKEWFERTLPERTYRDPDEVIRAFKI